MISKTPANITLFFSKRVLEKTVKNVQRNWNFSCGLKKKVGQFCNYNSVVQMQARRFTIPPPTILVSIAQQPVISGAVLPSSKKANKMTNRLGAGPWKKVGKQAGTLLWTSQS